MPSWMACCSGSTPPADIFHRVREAACPDSLRLDVGRLDDRPPLLDLGLMIGAEGFRRLLLARENLLP